MRKVPRWVTAFLRALERSGDARAAAQDAGIDHTTAYARRRAHAEFAAAWAAALEAHRAERKRLEEEEIAALRDRPSPSHSSAAVPSLSREGRGASVEEPLVSGGKVRRVGRERWSKRKEAAFFDELGATANGAMAAAAAGVSQNAVFARRLRHPVFAAKWEAVVRTAKASIDLYLVEETRKSFELETLDTASIAPRVTIDQAIRISQIGAAAAGRGKGQAEADPFAQPEHSYEQGIRDIRERLVEKLQALRRRDRPELLERGWSYDESWDREIPPGWVKGPDYRPREAEDLG